VACSLFRARIGTLLFQTFPLITIVRRKLSIDTPHKGEYFPRYPISVAVPRNRNLCTATDLSFLSTLTHARCKGVDNASRGVIAHQTELI
jgi:hypothetical protein